MMEEWESDQIVEKWIQENDTITMPLPSIESDPLILISKVRKHYMEHVIKLLSVNYETNQKLLNKNIYLPSAIWRCAKIIEMSAVQASMVVQLYRKNITEVIKDLKNNTKKGLLYRKLYECLHYAPQNDKKVQTTVTKSKDCNCQCSCNQRKKMRRISESPKDTSLLDNDLAQSIQLQTQKEITTTNCNSSNLLKTNTELTSDLKGSDDIMQQLDKLFRGGENDDDLFERVLCATDNSIENDDYVMPAHNENPPSNSKKIETQQKPLDARLALLSGVLVNKHETNTQYSKNNNKKPRISKWLCEEYFQKAKLFELLDQIRDNDRSKLIRVKERLLDIFGEDSDEEDVVSPLEESSEFVSSCKERITPWVVKILTPYYVKGRIRGKNLFKSLAKHLISLIYKCSKYPNEYEVQSFIKDFLDSHKLIRCEADFQQFRIENY